MKESFEPSQIAEFLRRSYFAVDGLWFVKAEERLGPDEAMQLDEAVWQVMPKLQSRRAKAILGIEDGSLEGLARAFLLKFTAEGHEFDVRMEPHQVTFTVTMCPWFEILKSSGRTHLAEPIADRICAREFAGWAAEFASDIQVRFEGRLCIASEASANCTIIFRQRKP